ncbi:MAG: Elongation factor Ts [candidate division TM6 bacterium GW2011_GWF2_38_10]|nr:MAG: Elongation factor Ts [candidate division TM6 bacterium GW2011_GWF2_38_10]
MATISMDLVKELREKTQVGMMDCKKALEQAGGDMEKAIEILRKKGTSVAAKRADNETNNGRVESWVSSDYKTGALVAVACETDFSANTEDMFGFASHVAQVAAQNDIVDAEMLLQQQSLKVSNLTIKDHLDEIIAKIAESIKVSKAAVFKASANGLVNVYIHPGSSIGVMVELEGDKAIAQNEEIRAAARDVCMQAAVTKPLAVSPEGIDSALIEKERAIATEQLQGSNKPANIIEKIVEGKLNKFYEDVCLLNQLFIKNDKLTVAQFLKEVGTKHGVALTVKRFVRFGIGR